MTLNLYEGDIKMLEDIVEFLGSSSKSDAARFAIRSLWTLINNQKK